MGPANAAKRFRALYDAGIDNYVVILYGSLAATGKGHMTDVAIENELKPKKVTFIWKANETLMFHVNGMTIKACKGEEECAQETYYSVGGGAIVVDSELSMIEGPYKKTFDKVYNYSTMNALIRWCRKTGLKMNDFVYQSEGEGIHDFLKMIWDTMKRCVEIGLQGKGVLPGGLNLPRKARDMYRAAQRSNASLSVASPSFILCRSTRISSPTRSLFPRTTRAARRSLRLLHVERAASCPVCSTISTNTTKTSPTRTASTRSPSPA